MFYKSANIVWWVHSKYIVCFTTYQKGNRAQIRIYPFNHELPLCLQLVWWFSAFFISFSFQFCEFMLNIDWNLFLCPNSIVMVKRPLQVGNMTTTSKCPIANIFRYAKLNGLKHISFKSSWRVLVSLPKKRQKCKLPQRHLHIISSAWNVLTLLIMYADMLLQ